jgi:hypothetical protein
MTNAILFDELMLQIKKQSTDRFDYCITSGQIKHIDLTDLKRTLEPVCQRTSVSMSDLTVKDLDSLTSTDWIEICTEWIVYCTMISDKDVDQHHDSQPDRTVEFISPVIYLLEDAVRFLLCEEVRLYSAAVHATRSLVSIYLDLDEGSLISDPHGSANSDLWADRRF